MVLSTPGITHEAALPWIGRYDDVERRPTWSGFGSGSLRVKADGVECTSNGTCKRL